MRVRAVQCRNCGGTARLQHGEKEALCLHCGSPVRLSDAIVAEQSRAERCPHTTPLRLGMKAQIRGKEYEATGRLVLLQREDDGLYRWEEWVLIAPDGDPLFLEFDEGRWKLGQPFIPETPKGPDQLEQMVPGAFLNLGHASAMVSDRGTYEVICVEGEFPWLITAGKRAHFVDATAGKQNYSVEWTEDEIEYYRGEYVDERWVLAAFDMREALTAVDARERVLRSRRSFGLVTLAAGVLALFIWMVSHGVGSVVPNGTGHLTIQRRPAGAEDPGTRFGPIKLTAVNRVHRLEVFGSMVQQSVWVQAVLEDEQEREILGVDRDMWDESGYDDGPWHESDLHASTTFVLRKAGNYYVRIYAEPETMATSSAPIAASFTLKERAVHTPYLGWFALLSLLLGGGFVIAGSPQQVRTFWQQAQSSSDD